MQQLQGSLLERQTHVGSRQGALEVRGGVCQLPTITRQQLAMQAGRSESRVLCAGAVPLLMPSNVLHAVYAQVDSAC